MNVPARYAAYFALCLLCLALTAIALGSLGVLEPTLMLLLSVPPWGIALLLLLTAVEFAAKVIRFSYCLPKGHTAAGLTFPYFFGTFLSLLVPFRLLGEGARPLVFKSYSRISYSASLSAISAERMLDMAFVVLFAAGTVGAFFSPPLALAILLAFLLFWYAVRSGQLAKLASLSRNRALHRFALSYTQSFSQAFSSPRRILVLASLTALTWALAFARLWLILFLLGSPLGPIESSAASSTAYLASLISFLPGGLVGFEGGGVAALSYFGIGLEPALAAVLLERAFSYWLFLALGPISALATGIAFPENARA